MRNPGGYATIVSPVEHTAKLSGFRCDVSVGLTEVDTFTCIHCNSVAHVPVSKRDTDYYFCRNCMGRICPPCADKPCIPFMKKIEQMEEEDRIRRSYGG